MRRRVLACVVLLAWRRRGRRHAGRARLHMEGHARHHRDRPDRAPGSRRWLQPRGLPAPARRRRGRRRGLRIRPAPGAITDARRLAADRPLTFEVADTVPDGWGDFGVAFSHEVLYLLEGLPAHAAALFGA